MGGFILVGHKKSQYRRPSIFAVLVFVVLTIRGLKKWLKTANSEGKLLLKD